MGIAVSSGVLLKISSPVISLPRAAMAMVSRDVESIAPSEAIELGAGLVFVAMAIVLVAMDGDAGKFNVEESIVTLRGSWLFMLD
jgi:hypothetical protein